MASAGAYVDLLADARRLAREAGLAPPVDLVPLAGGKNNRVFRAMLGDGRAVVLKSYFHDPRDRRDRLGAEWAFLRYAWARGVRNVPEPLAADPASHLGLYTSLPGRRLLTGEVVDRHVEAAVAFVLAVNARPREPLTLPAGSEACFSLAQHVATVERRVSRLAKLDTDAPLREEAQRFVSGRLLPAWYDVKSFIRTGTETGLDEPLAAAELVISPSDFGFHNALVEDDGVAFIDFEYAGRDDPAKLVCDFFCQPDVPVPIALFASTAARLIGGLGLPDRHLERCRLLIDLYRIKWACIILNHFLPLGAARRAFAGEEHARERAAFQLDRAAAKLAECGS